MHKLSLILMLLIACPLAANEINWAAKATVRASSQSEKFVPDNINDGIVSDGSRWLSNPEDKNPWIEMSFHKPITVGMIDVFSGWLKADALSDYDISIEVNGIWKTKKIWQVRANKQSSKRIYIDQQEISKIRLSLLKANVGRIREIAVYDNKEAQGIKDLTDGTTEQVQIDFKQHQIAVNQVGYLTGRPKRFTAPLSKDGALFKVREKETNRVLFEGEIKNKIGDFSEFNPLSSSKHYIIDLTGGQLKLNVSDAFLITDDLDKDQYWQSAVDFLIDVRSVTGTHPSAYGGCAWRDGTYYDAIVPALVKFYLADSAVIDFMPRQINWQADKKRINAPDFKFDKNNPCSGGVMDAVRNYYELEAPLDTAPDVVKLIHWGAGYILMKPNGRDPSNSSDSTKIEPQTVEQITYVLWAWPILKKWLPQSFYYQCLDFCFKHWKGSLSVSTHWDPKTYTSVNNWKGKSMHPFKGRHAPGHSIVPNIIMYEVALREGYKDSSQYLNAAIKQAQWIIDNLDWKDSRTTKGHRLSEHRTIPNLVWLLQKYPNQAPEGLKEKITDWARVALSRSDNLWDFRRFDDELWTIPGMNEVGNSLSLPAIYLSASWVVDDSALQKRLVQLAFASIDHVFGRNPMLAAAPSQADKGFPEIERSWPKHYKKDVCARLEHCRGNIASLPGSEMYPFQPGKSFRHPEGWANYGAAWCISLSYLQYDKKKTSPDITD